jgi:hypothetical protein
MKPLVSCIALSLVISSAMAQGRFKIEPVFSIHFPILPTSINLGGEVYDELNASFVSTRSSSDGSGINRSIGFIGELPIGSKISIRIGAAYAPKDFIGMRTEPCDCNERTAEEPIMFKQRYVDIPFMLRYYILTKRITFFAEAGGVVNVLLRNKVHYVSWDYASKWDVSEIQGVNLSETMVGMHGGIGVGYSLNNRLDLMLSTVYRQVLTEYTPTDDYQPRAIVATLGIALKFGREKSE